MDNKVISELTVDLLVTLCIQGIGYWNGQCSQLVTTCNCKCVDKILNLRPYMTSRTIYALHLKWTDFFHDSQNFAN